MVDLARPSSDTSAGPSNVLQVVSVALPVAVDRAFTYVVPAAWPCSPAAGSRVRVQLSSREVVGVVRPVQALAQADAAGETYQLKPLLSCLDREDQPALPADVVAICEWVTRYYLAPVGEVYRLALTGVFGEEKEQPPPSSAVQVTLEPAYHGVAEDELQKLGGRSAARKQLLSLLFAAPDHRLPLQVLRSSIKNIHAHVQALKQRGVVAQQAVKSWQETPLRDHPVKNLTRGQIQALAELEQRLSALAFHVALLHGVTGSGKTEVYLRLIAKARALGKQALVLVPEIALTPQLADRFREQFHEQVAVLHSGLTKAQRLRAWQGIRAGRFPIVIGARSAVFAPLAELGVIVVDEEHDSSFKQEDGVRYHARDVAIVRGQTVGCLVVLGSATPSLETYAHAKAGRYGWLSLPTRATRSLLPEVEVVALSAHKANPETLLTARLRDALAKTIASGEQAILFLNRRGYAPIVQCASCGAFQTCNHCSGQSLTAHMRTRCLRCHLCGHREPIPRFCRECKGTELLFEGAGTERIEAALGKEFPDLRMLRLDRDSTRGAGLLDILGKFRRYEADVLIGTQMLAKGHDFPGVTLVGILQADQGLGYPDLRAAEHTFQLLTQVAGRAGRGDKPGRVFIQAYNLRHPAITHAARHDYAGFAEQELTARQALSNPPYGYLALIRITGRVESAVDLRANELATTLSGLAKRLRASHAHESEHSREPIK